MLSADYGGIFGKKGQKSRRFAVNYAEFNMGSFSYGKNGRNWNAGLW